MSLTTPAQCSEVADRVTRNSDDCVRLLREPGAANPHARFDERDVETEHGSAREAPADERAGNGWAAPKPPRHISTLLLNPDSRRRARYERVDQMRANEACASGYQSSSRLR